jgi:hypothetical protein
MKRSAVPLLLALVAGALLFGGSAALAGSVTHRVSVGSSDSVVFPPGTDANFSLVAIERSDGTVRGEWHDQFGGHGDGAPFVGQFVHVDITCLEVDGNEAWVSGPIKAASSDLAEFIGTPAITRVSDNGTSAKDPADQISFTFFDIPPDLDCLDKPALPLFDLNNGEVKVR